MNTLKPLFYKEWIKTQIVIVGETIIMLLLLFYVLYNFKLAANAKGLGHLWSVMIDRDVHFVERLRYIPMLLGTLTAIAQMIPETMQKRIKLTLHLPCSDTQIIFNMLLYGVLYLTSLYVISLLCIFGFFAHYLPQELMARIFWSMIPWLMAGWAAYFVTTWVVLETSIFNRVVAALMAVGLMGLYFVGSVPEAYSTGMLVGLMFETLFCASLSFYTVIRFRKGLTH